MPSVCVTIICLLYYYIVFIMPSKLPRYVGLSHKISRHNALSVVTGSSIVSFVIFLCRYYLEFGQIQDGLLFHLAQPLLLDYMAERRNAEVPPFRSNAVLLCFGELITIAVRPSPTDPEGTLLHMLLSELLISNTPLLRSLR